MPSQASAEPFSWENVPVTVPDDYKNYIGCKIIPISNNLLEIHGLKLCSNKRQASIKQHDIRRLPIRETVDVTGKNSFIYSTFESREIKVCYTCLLRTRHFCQKQGLRGKKLKECFTYLSWWDNLAKTVNRGL